MIQMVQRCCGVEPRDRCGDNHGQNIRTPFYKRTTMLTIAPTRAILPRDCNGTSCIGLPETRFHIRAE